MKAPQQYHQKESTVDSMKLAASSKVDDELMGKLIDQEVGVLRPGALPKVEAATVGGCSKLMTALTADAKAQTNSKSRLLVSWFLIHLIPSSLSKTHDSCQPNHITRNAPLQQVSNQKNPKKKEEKSEAAKPKTIQEELNLKVKELLKSAALARTASITLSGLEFADTLAKALLTQASDMERLYKSSHKALKEKQEEKVLRGYLKEVDESDKHSSKLQAGFWSRVKLQSVLPPIKPNEKGPFTHTLLMRCGSLQSNLMDRQRPMLS